MGLAIRAGECVDLTHTYSDLPPLCRRMWPQDLKISPQKTMEKYQPHVAEQWRETERGRERGRWRSNGSLPHLLIFTAPWLLKGRFVLWCLPFNHWLRTRTYILLPHNTCSLKTVCCNACEFPASFIKALKWWRLGVRPQAIITNLRRCFKAAGAYLFKNKHKQVTQNRFYHILSANIHF